MQNLSYPDDVEGDNNRAQGHYIMFLINETEAGKVATGRGHASDAAASAAAGRATAATRRAERVTAWSNKKFIDQQLNQGAGAATWQSAPSSGGLHMVRPSTTRMAQAITLYMPPSVKVNYQANYKEDEIGWGAAAASESMQQGIKAFQAKGGEGWEAWAEGLTAGGTAAVSDLGAGAVQWMKKHIDKVPGAEGAATLASISAGSVIGSKMELLFTGMQRRSFTFQFNFIPKSDTESITVHKIVQTFKEQMLPRYMEHTTLFGHNIGTAGGRILTIPNTFDIFYFYQSNENPFLNRISTCYLTNLEIEYGGDKYITYESIYLDGQSGPPPQRTSITLSFNEIEIITKERAQEGF